MPVSTEPPEYILQILIEHRATFYHLPLRSLFTAVSGAGAYIFHLDGPEAPMLPPLLSRERLEVQDILALADSALLFYPGQKGEMRFVEYLKEQAVLENIYRFGGFANDCTRLALGLEQVQVQFSVKAWDFSATLFENEAGLRVVVDPNGTRASSRDWVVSASNPIIASLPSLMPDLLALFEKSTRTRQFESR